MESFSSSENVDFEVRNMKSRVSVRFITEGAVIAALYVALTLIFAPFSFSAVQVRIAEALAILPMFTFAAVPGLFLGCIIANLLGGAIAWDVIFGSLATLIGAAIGYQLRANRWLVPIPTVISNALIIPLVLRYGYGVNLPVPLLIVYIAVGEFLGSYLLGELLGTVLLRYGKRLFRRHEESDVKRKD